MYRVIVLLSLSLVMITADHNHDWNYEEYGPEVWNELYPICGGELQSPINILTACTVYKNFTPFIFEGNYAKQYNFTLRNNGHTIVGTLNNETELTDLKLTGGDLNGTFEFVNFHLHWGANHKSGSEHEINGLQYPGEVHFVYSNLLTNQTAVLGIFMKTLFSDNETHNTIDRHSDDNDTRKEWQKYFDIAQTLRLEDNSTMLNLNLTLLMGDNLNDFWRYQGSLTTPPCTENVLWTIFKQPILFNENEFQSFRKNIYFEDYRRSQPLYNRIIYRNFPNETLSAIPDYNCCPNSNSYLLSNQSMAFYSLVNLIFLLNCIFSISIFDILYFYE